MTRCPGGERSLTAAAGSVNYVAPRPEKNRLTLESVPRFILTAMDGISKSLRPGQLARLAGVSPDTLRHYERLGILRAATRTVSGYRMYGPDAPERVALAQRALQLGFTLRELGEILRARDNGEAPCRRVLDLTEEKLRSLEQRIEQLRRTRRYLRQLVQEWRLQVARTGPGRKAMLLQSLQSNPAPPSRPADNLRRRKQT